MKKGIDYIGVSVVFFCHDGKGNFLLHKRSKNCRDEQGRWDCGGGAMKFGESFEEAVRREVIEEYCTDIKDLQFIATSNILREHTNIKTHWIAFIFAAKVDPSLVKIGDPEKMDEIGWFTAETLPEPMHSMFAETLTFMKDFKVIN
jgi:8-oxo-dGTP diphosphatase